MMPNRTDVLNHLAERYNLKRYLEIGVQDPVQNFDKINCHYKIGVDPDPRVKAAFNCTSDAFFETEFDRLFVTDDSETKFDLIFIDGLHTAEQVRKDFENSLKILSTHGFIVLHDCNPEKEEHTIVPRPAPTGHWNGDVYKFAGYLGYGHDCYYTVDVDNGCGIWANCDEDYVPNDYIQKCEWDWFDKNRKKVLNLISWDEFIRL